MASNGRTFEEGGDALRREVVSDVMSACVCSEAQALSLLEKSGNDATSAKYRHQMMKKFMHRSLPGHTKPSVPPAPPPIGGMPHHQHAAEDFSDHSSDESGFNNTPHTEDEALPKLSSDAQQIIPSYDLVKFTVEHEESLEQPQHANIAPVNSDNIDSANSRPESLLWQDNAAHEIAYRDYMSVSEGTEVQATNSVLHSEEEESNVEWDFVLPRIPAPTRLAPVSGDVVGDFNLTDLVGALQQRASEQMIRSYLEYFEQSTITRQINETVGGFPSIFFAVETNDDWVVRIWIAYGGDVNAIHDATKVPLLAFAIVHSETINTDTTNVVATLLSLGAFTHAIPSAFYTPYYRDLPDDGPDEESLGDLSTDTRKWFTISARAKLARTINLTHRYNLERATRMKQPSIRQKQVAYRRNAEALLGLPYFLIGQSMAAGRLLQKCLSHLAVPGKKPLVLTFAGPSGHGKTELARRLGYLMSLELEVVDCTVVNREIELFGGRHPYVNADQGTSLNNFLVRNAGKRCIVFLDEFEKTTTEIHQALLLPFDNGEYQDRRKPNDNKIDCSKTVWILATNALDTTIRSFCHLNDRALFHDEDEPTKLHLIKRLSKELKQDFLTQFGAPITGRISAFLPFLLFSPGEQAVVAHKYLLELGRDVRGPVNLTATPSQDERLVGNVRLRVRRDASVCRALAEDGYHPDLGARSLITAVNSVRELLVEAYLGVDEVITNSKDDAGVDFVVDVSGGEVVAGLVSQKAKG